MQEQEENGSQDGLTPEQTAAEIAPSIDAIRARIAEGLVALLGSTDLVPRAGVPLQALELFALLRGAASGRSLALEGVRAAWRYVPGEQTAAALDHLDAAGLVSLDDGGVSLTRAGLALQTELVDATTVVVDRLWPEQEALGARLEGLADRALARAAQDGGPAFEVLFPPYDPPGCSSTARLAERVACLRFHRADAHAAAWQAAGLTLEQLRSRTEPLPPQVETDTDRRAGVPYQSLTAGERRELVDGLRSMID